MDGLEFPFPDRRSPAPGAEGAAGSPADSSSSLLEDARWVMANMPTVQLFATDTPEKEKQLKQLPAAATPQRQGQDPRVATRNFPSPWLRQPKTSPRSVGSALDRASARGKARMESGGLRRALSVLSDITNAQRSSPKASPKASPKITRRALTTAAVASPKGSPGGSAGFFYREQVREGPSGAAKPSGAGGASKDPPPSPAPEAAPDPEPAPAPAPLPATPEPEPELDATSTPSESESEKLARLAKLQAELRLLQLFSERKACAIQEGRPDSVRLSMGSVQVKADGSDEWTTVEPSVAVVEVQPDAAKAAAPTAEEEATTPAPEDGGGSAARGGVLRPGTPSSESTPSDCAAKEQELAKLKGEHLHKTSLHNSFEIAVD